MAIWSFSVMEDKYAAKQNIQDVMKQNTWFFDRIDEIDQLTWRARIFDH